MTVKTTIAIALSCALVGAGTTATTQKQEVQEPKSDVQVECLNSSLNITPQYDISDAAQAFIDDCVNSLVR